MSSYDIRPAFRVDRLFQLLLATLADMAIEAIENSSWRRHLIHANRAFRSSYDVRLALRAKRLLPLKLNLLQIGWPMKQRNTYKCIYIKI